jgi:hypothetical protein
LLERIGAMKMPWSNRQGPMKLLAICATALLIALGMCGLQGAVFWGFFRPLPKGGDALIVSMIVLGYVELGVGLLSIVGIVVALLWLLFKTIASSSERRSQ